jgi:hypothetical protein
MRKVMTMDDGRWWLGDDSGDLKINNQTIKATAIL